MESVFDKSFKSEDACFFVQYIFNKIKFNQRNMMQICAIIIERKARFSLKKILMGKTEMILPLFELQFISFGLCILFNECESR